MEPTFVKESRFNTTDCISDYWREKDKEKKNKKKDKKGKGKENIVSQPIDNRAIQVFPSYFNLKRHFHKNLIS